MLNSDWDILKTKNGIWVVRKVSPRCKILVSDKNPKPRWQEEKERSVDEGEIIEDAKKSDAWKKARLLDI